MAELRQTLTPKNILKAQLLNRLKFSALLQLPEKEFAKMISDIESNGLFKKLLRWTAKDKKVISIKRFPNVKLSSNFYELNETLKDSSGSVDVESLLHKHQGIVQLIQKIGQQNFERYFLYREDPLSPSEIAEACGIDQAAVEQVQTMLLELAIHSDFFHPSELPNTEQEHYSLIAKFEVEGQGQIVFSYLSPHMTYGRYVVDYEKLKSARADLTPDEKKELNALLSKMDWVNARHDTMHKILTAIGQTQQLYLNSGKLEDLMPCSQRRLAQEIKVAPSTISRAIYNKSVLTPWNQERKLKDLFANKKQVMNLWLQDFIAQTAQKPETGWTDEKLRAAFIQKFNCPISRRTINAYRNQIIKKT